MNFSRKTSVEYLSLNITYYREAANLTQRQLAQTIGVSQAYISKLESLRTFTNITLDKLLLISEALDIPIQSLFCQNNRFISETGSPDQEEVT